ncbi:hypothetical protein CQW23_01315 [Capsicum baccatum]|uniref:NB-ARC domain-containing protein n=1 Tax=Capsicum baccatum TaxID=33114 RepID=A0A2G2XN85_CAPBA|nr:hypothetical protein CQW23_01315 [Capsicum baccatum]
MVIDFAEYLQRKCESRFIQEIVKVVAVNLNRAVSSVALHPVGIDSRVDIMAIYGMGGIGKSTLVKTAYNLNFNKFDGNNFLADVNKTSERHNGLVSLQNEIEEMLDHLRRIKSGADLDSFKIDQIEKLKMDLRLLRTFVKNSHFLWSNSIVKITKKARRIVKMLCGDFVGIPDECKTNLDLKRLESQLLKVIDGNTSLSYNSELNGSDLSKYMDCLGENLNDVLLRHRESNRSYLERNQFTKQLEIVQKKMKVFRYLYATKINGYVNHEKLECLET